MIKKETIKEKIRGSVAAEAWLAWYEFRQGASLLEIGPDNPSHTALFRRRCENVTVLSDDMADAAILPASFDYAVSYDRLEYREDPAAAIRTWMSFLKPGGILLLGADNRYGLKYFCGGREKHTGVPYYGVNGYFNAAGSPLPESHTDGGRSFSKKELVEVLGKAGVQKYQFFYPVPDAEMPQMIYTDDWKDGSDAAARLRDYHYADDSMMALEHRLFPEAVDAGILPFVSDSFLIEITKDGVLSDAEYAVITAERGKERAMTTVIHGDGRVVKRPLYPEGEVLSEKTAKITEELRKKEVPVLPCTLKNDTAGSFLELPRIKYELFSQTLKRMAGEDREGFFELYDKLNGAILRSFDAAEGRLFPDLVPGNAFWDETDGRIIFFDQEFAVSGNDPGFVLFRGIKYFFMSPERTKWKVQAEDLYKRYGITKEMTEKFEEEETKFLALAADPEQLSWIIDYSVPDTKRMFQKALLEAAEADKPYQVGYVPGVFDLFHTGHLRLIRRCKARCRYLIVGVLTDELAEYYKGRRPVIPFEERRQIIEALKDVDEVVAVNFDNTDKIRAHEQLHYDCHFSGDDHVGHWDDIKKELNRRGAEMEFFSYTQGVSTTEIIREIRTGEESEPER